MKSVKKAAELALLTAALILVSVLVSCGIKTYNIIDPGKPTDAFAEFYRAVSDGDDAAANELLYNYEWHSFKPEKKTGMGGYVVNGITVSGADAMVFDVMLRSRSCRVISESDYGRDDLKSSVTVSYMSFDLAKFQKALSKIALSEVKEKQREGVNFSSAEETRQIIDSIKIELLKDPHKYNTTRRFKINLICDKGKWKVVLSEDFYKALSGNTD